MNILKLFGPPGTGKTTSIVKMISGLYSAGTIRIDRVYGLSLTRAARAALIDRMKEDLNLSVSQVLELKRNIRTLHSFAFHRLGIKRQDMITQKELAAFFSRYDIEYFIEDEQEIDEFSSYPAEFSSVEGNRLYQMFNLIRMTLELDRVGVFYERYADEGFPASKSGFKKLLEEYLEYLEREDRFDFTRLLTEADRLGLDLSGDVLIIDEAQDITPLMAKILQKCFSNFKLVIISGDDDQAIFTFAGATPDFLLRTPGTVKVLPQSYRIPRDVYVFALNIISKNRYRLYKHYSPRAEDGFISYIYSKDEAFKYFNKPSYILCRNRLYVDEWCELLRSNAIPFSIIGRKHTLPKLASNIWLLMDLRKGKNPLTVKPVKDLLTFLKVGRVKGTTHDRIAKAIINNRVISGTPEHKIYEYLIKTPLNILLQGYDSTEVLTWVEEYRRKELWLSPMVRVGTIHSAKGLEANHIVLDTRMTRRTFYEAMRNPEPERRVSYTGVTRAIEGVLIYGDGVFS